MAQNQIHTTCFLCGQPATCGDTDFGNRKFYQCSAADCGDYEISVTALRRLENATSHKEQLKQLAHGYRGTDKLVEIVVGADNQIAAKAVLRDSSARS